MLGQAGKQQVGGGGGGGVLRFRLTDFLQLFPGCSTGNVGTGFDLPPPHVAGDFRGGEE